MRFLKKVCVVSFAILISIKFLILIRLHGEKNAFNSIYEIDIKSATGIRCGMACSLCLNWAAQSQDSKWLVRFYRQLVIKGYAKKGRRVNVLPAVFEAAIWERDCHVARHSLISLYRRGWRSDEALQRLKLMFDWRFTRDLDQAEWGLIVDARYPEAYHFDFLGCFVRGLGSEWLGKNDDAISFFKKSLRDIPPSAEADYAETAVHNLGTIVKSNPGEGEQG